MSKGRKGLSSKTRGVYTADALQLYECHRLSGRNTVWSRLGPGSVFTGKELGRRKADHKTVYWARPGVAPVKVANGFRQFKNALLSSLQIEGLESAVRSRRRKRTAMWLRVGVAVAAACAVALPGGQAAAAGIMAGGQAAISAMSDGRVSVDEIMGVVDAAASGAGVDLDAELAEVVGADVVQAAAGVISSVGGMSRPVPGDDLPLEDAGEEQADEVDEDEAGNRKALLAVVHEVRRLVAVNGERRTAAHLVRSGASSAAALRLVHAARVL